MKENIEILVKWLADFFGTSLDNASLSLLLALAAILFPLFSKGISYFIKLYRRRVVTSDLEPFLYSNEVEFALKKFVRTKFQNVNPGNFNYLEDNESYAVSEDLISHFTRVAFKRAKDSTRYFIILADAGMGKTTFMINLYYRYRKRFRWFGLIKGSQIKLFPLGDERTIEAITQIKNEAKSTILLLDAFDEFDIKNQYGDNKLEFLLSKVSRFKQVVITSRTQYFKTSEEEPSKTGIFKTGPNPDEWLFGKFYISPFSDKDVSKYINKSIPFFLFKKKAKARKLLLNYRDLRFRPMLISHLPALVNTPKLQVYTYLVYEYLLENWLNREMKKVKKDSHYKEQLYSFSFAVCRYLLTKKSLHINLDEILKIANKNGIILDDLDITSRSLLNRNSENMYKFSHKSIFEYLVSTLLFKGELSEREIDFRANDLIYVFYKEMCENRVFEPILTKLNLKHNSQYSVQIKNKINSYTGVDCFSPVGSNNQSVLWTFDYFSLINSNTISEAFSNDYPQLKQFYTLKYQYENKESSAE